MNTVDKEGKFCIVKNQDSDLRFGSESDQKR
jgi:hypothetical protein